MTAQKLDGRAAAAQITDELRERVAALKDRGVTPGIATVLVGADPASQLYVGMKHRESEAIVMSPVLEIDGALQVEGGVAVRARDVRAVHLPDVHTKSRDFH